VLLRHGQTQWNVEGRFQGHSDIPLDAMGEQQAATAATVLAELRPDAIVSSDLVRALATAAPLAAATGRSVELDERLRETHGGGWEGMRDADIGAEHADDWWAWRHGADIRAGLTGESRTMVAQRATTAITEHADRLEYGQTLVVVTHGGVANAAIGSLLNLPVTHWQTLGGLGNCQWAILRAWVTSRQDSTDQPLPAAWRLASYGVGPRVAAERIRG